MAKMVLEEIWIFVEEPKLIPTKLCVLHSVTSAKFSSPENFFNIITLGRVIIVVIVISCNISINYYCCSHCYYIYCYSRHIFYSSFDVWKNRHIFNTFQVSNLFKGISHFVRKQNFPKNEKEKKSWLENLR